MLEDLAKTYNSHSNNNIKLYNINDDNYKQKEKYLKYLTHSLKHALVPLFNTSQLGGKDNLTDSIEYIDSDKIKPISKNDQKCAPALRYENGSCMKLDILLQIIEGYNKYHTDNKIKLCKNIKDEKKYKRYLVYQLRHRFPNKSQREIFDDPFVQNLSDELKHEIENFIWRPVGPVNEEWFSTVDLDGILYQCERVYPEFKYGGTLPRDAQKHNSLKKTKEDYISMFKKGIRQYGIVYNTDKLYQSGQHWNALFVEIIENNDGTTDSSIEFFDSYGVEPNSDVEDHMKFIAEAITEYFGSKCLVKKNKQNLVKEFNCSNIDLKVNKERAQYGNNACGPYSTYFIKSRLNGMTFDEFCKSKFTDDHVNALRKKWLIDKNEI